MMITASLCTICTKPVADTGVGNLCERCFDNFTDRIFRAVRTALVSVVDELATVAAKEAWDGLREQHLKDMSRDAQSMRTAWVESLDGQSRALADKFATEFNQSVTELVAKVNGVAAEVRRDRTTVLRALSEMQELRDEIRQIWNGAA